MKLKVLAMIRALIFTWEVGISSIIIEGDSLVVINSFRGEDDSFASYGLLIVDAKILTKSFIGINFNFSY